MTRRKYSKDEKLKFILYRLQHQLSYKETAKVFGIMNPTLIAQWQMKYNDYGILGLESKSKGRVSKHMNSHKNNPQNNKSLNETEREELERLHIQNKKLEIAIALEKVTILSSRKSNKEKVAAIIELRKEYNITQTELSIKTNISRQTINMLENNSYIPSLKTAKRLAMFFNTSIECIFIFEEEDL